jgi:membrane protease YdiL (CAAX protease family)
MKISYPTLRPWLYLAFLFGSQLIALILLGAVWAFVPGFRYWVETPLGTFSVTVFGMLAAFSVVALLSGSRHQLFRLFEFHSIGQGFSYLSIGAGLALGLTGVLLTRLGVAHFAENYPMMRPFVRFVGPQTYLFGALLLLGPIFEEIIMRGFLYRAFRRAYGVPLSTSALVVVAMLMHPGVFAASLWLFILLAVLQILLCSILEKTRNLWNCIACHCAYNAVATCAWLIQISS